MKQILISQGYKPASDSPTNQQFFIVPNRDLEVIGETVSFDVSGTPGETETLVRFCTDWGTTDEDIRHLAEALKRARG